MNDDAQLHVYENVRENADKADSYDHLRCTNNEYTVPNSSIVGYDVRKCSEKLTYALLDNKPSSNKSNCIFPVFHIADPRLIHIERSLTFPSMNSSYRPTEYISVKPLRLSSGETSGKEIPGNTITEKTDTFQISKPESPHIRYERILTSARYERIKTNEMSTCS